QDLQDTDLIRVNNTYYSSASSLHFSPGAPILRSYDLINWEYLSHSIPSLGFSNCHFDLQGGNVYNGGAYASSLRYNERTGFFYWVGCIQSVGQTFFYMSVDIEGPWEQTSVIKDYCYYDDGPLIDDDGSMDVAYGRWIWVAQLTEDLQQKRVETVFYAVLELGYIDGARFYKINGRYYLWLTSWSTGYGQVMLKSSDGPFGPYEHWHQVLLNSGNPVAGVGYPYQGAIDDTSGGDWWYMAFVNRYPGGRLPVLAPISWDTNG
ncbi:glycosyl hydrolase, partial [Dactylonectria macrodidyma]